MKMGWKEKEYPQHLHSYSNLQQVNSSTIASTVMPEDIVVALMMRQRGGKAWVQVGVMRRQGQSPQAEWDFK